MSIQLTKGTADQRIWGTREYCDRKHVDGRKSRGDVVCFGGGRDVMVGADRLAIVAIPKKGNKTTVRQRLVLNRSNYFKVFKSILSGPK